MFFTLAKKETGFWPRLLEGKTKASVPSAFVCALTVPAAATSDCPNPPAAYCGQAAALTVPPLMCTALLFTYLWPLHALRVSYSITGLNATSTNGRIRTMKTRRENQPSQTTTTCQAWKASTCKLYVTSIPCLDTMPCLAQTAILTRLWRVSITSLCLARVVYTDSCRGHAD